VVDDRLMHRAIELAQEWPHTHPNPRVGAVVVDDSGRVVGEGRHLGPGTDHAEVVALEDAGDSALGATVYVTLEPCTHHGRTPPCVDALTVAGVSTVVIAAIDPDSKVAGEGVRLLEEAGVEVVTGVAEAQARQVDPAYFHHRETGMPLVTVKWAMTIDGSVAANDGTSQWITADLARAQVHDLRAQVDAVVVGAGTFRADDPRLDVRIEGYAGAQPRPVVVAGRDDLPQRASLWDRDPIVVSTLDRRIPSGDLVIVNGFDGYPDPVEVCHNLADRGFLHLLVEGGPTLAGAWWRAGVIHNGFVHIGAKVGGGTGRSPMVGDFGTIADADEVEFEEVRSVGEDVVVAFRKRQ
jgi:diaminohydroxyphosphoribosylaminopyrimidine deaminase/5-amino-6-(5-phosphoribosylamino)uracil reductase